MPQIQRAQDALKYNARRVHRAVVSYIAEIPLMRMQLQFTHTSLLFVLRDI